MPQTAGRSWVFHLGVVSTSGATTALAVAPGSAPLNPAGELALEHRVLARHLRVRADRVAGGVVEPIGDVQLPLNGVPVALPDRVIECVDLHVRCRRPVVAAEPARCG